MRTTAQHDIHKIIALGIFFRIETDEKWQTILSENQKRSLTANHMDLRLLSECLNNIISLYVMAKQLYS